MRWRRRERTWESGQKTANTVRKQRNAKTEQAGLGAANRWGAKRITEAWKIERETSFSRLGEPVDHDSHLFHAGHIRATLTARA